MIGFRQALEPVADGDENVFDFAVLQLGEDLQPEPRSFTSVAGPDPEDLPLPIRDDAHDHVERGVARLPVAYLDDDHIDEEHRGKAGPAAGGTVSGPLGLQVGRRAQTCPRSCWSVCSTERGGRPRMASRVGSTTSNSPRRAAWNMPREKSATMGGNPRAIAAVFQSSSSILTRVMERPVSRLRIVAISPRSRAAVAVSGAEMPVIESVHDGAATESGITTLLLPPLGSFGPRGLSLVESLVHD